MRILTAYDGSEYSNTAIEDLKWAGLPDKVEAVVLTVGEAWELPLVVDRVSSGTDRFVHPNVAVIEEHLKEVSEKARVLAEPAVDRLTQLFPEWDVRAEIRCGRPSVEIVKMADEISPDLLVVGSQGRSAIGRVFLGSVSHNALHEANCSVRIARGPGKDEDPDIRVLVAVDGSENSMAAIQAAAERRWPENAEIRIVAVNDPFARPRSSYISWNLSEGRPHDTDEARAWIEKVVDRPTAMLSATGCSISHSLRLGDAANMILAEASEWKASSIFVGARGLGSIKRFLLGSVSTAVASKAGCSVEVIRTTNADAAEVIDTGR